MKHKHTLSSSTSIGLIASMLKQSKLLMLLILLAFTLWTGSSKAQTVVTFGSGTTTTSGTYIPFYSPNGYSYTQQLYLYNEIGSANSGYIQKIAFYINTFYNWNNSKDWAIYLGTTTKTSFASTTDWVPLASMTKVFDGITAGSATGWYTITLQTPYYYSYSTTNNLVLAVDENTPAGTGSANVNRTYAATNRCLYYTNSSTNPNPSSPPTATRISYVDQLQLTINTACVAPGIPAAIGTATGITSNSATLNWSASTTGSATISYYYEVYNTSNVLIYSNSTTATSVTLTNMLPPNTYYYKVRANSSCSGTFSGYTASSATFTIPCSATPPTDTLVNANQSICPGGSTAAILVNGGTGSKYLINSPLTSAPANTSIVGNSNYNGSYLVMTNAGSQVAGLFVNNPNSYNSSQFTFQVDEQISSGGADGVSFNYAGDITQTLAGVSTNPEGGVGTGLTVGITTYSGNGGPYMALKYGGILLTPTISASPAVTSGWITFQIIVNSLNQVTVKAGATTMYNNIQLPSAYGAANKSTWNWTIAGRTGGVSENLYLRNLSILLPDQYEYTFNGGTSYQSSNSYTPPSTTATYNVNFRQIGSICPVTVGIANINVYTDTTLITGSSLTAQTQCINGTFSPISVTATGINPTYQWWKNTVPSTTGGTSLGSANGAQTNTYSPQATVNGVLYYYCVVHSNCGTDKTSPVSEAFTVNPVSQPILLVLTPDYTSVSGSFTRSAGADEYLVVRSTSPTFGATLPASGTTYISGNGIGGNIVVALTTDSTFIDAGLNQGTQYFYYIFAANSGCAAGITYLTPNPLTAYTVTLSNLPCVTPVNLPTALVFTTGNTTISGSFTGTTPNSDYYLVIRSTSPTLSAGPVDLTPYAPNDPIGGGFVVSYQIGSITTFTDNGLTAGTHYYYFVYSVSTFCVGGPLYSAISLNNNIYTNCIAPTAQVTALTLTPNLNSVGIAFIASASADHYLVVRNTTGTTPTAPVNGTQYTPYTSTLGAGNLVIAYQTVTSLTDTGLTPGTHYYYWVYAANSICSNGPVYFTTSPLTANTYTNCPMPTAQPSALVLTPSGNGTIGGSFTAASPAPDHYLILRSTSNAPSVLPSNGSTYTAGTTLGNCYIVANQASTTTTFTDNTGLTASNTYYYFIFSSNWTNCTIYTYLTSAPLQASAITGNYQSVGIANCNKDVVMNGNMVGTLSTTADCDDAGWGIMASDYTAGTGAPCTSSGAMFWPSTLASSLNSGLTYTLLPAAGNNAFQVASSGSGTLNLSNQVTANALYLLYFSATNTTGTLPSVVVNFSDLTSQTITGTNLGMQNWCQANATYNCYGTRLYRCGLANTACSIEVNPYWSQMTLPISAANQNKLITSITINNTTGKLSVFAVGIAAMPLPTCWTPTAVTSSSVLGHTAHVSWTAPTPAPSVGYEYEIRTSGVGGSGATGLAQTGTTTNTYVDLTGLTPETTFRVYVRSSCGPTDGYSTWSNLFTFTTTPSCLPPIGVNANLVTATSAHIYWTAPGIVPSDGYEWEIRTSGAPQSGPVGYTDDGATTALYEDVTSLTALTTYTLYVRGNCGAVDGNSTWASYTFTTTPSCFTPTALTVSAVTSTTAHLSWTPPAILPSIGYEWEIRTSGAAGSGATGLAQSGTNFLNSTNLTGLSPQTTYYVYIRSDCDAGTFSLWSTPINFTTACAEVAIFPWTENFDGMSTIGPSIVPNCWKVEPTSGNPWASANGASNTYNDPASSPYYITCSSTPSATDKYLITPDRKSTRLNSSH